MLRKFALYAAVLSVFTGVSLAEHPQVLVSAGDREAIAQKLSRADWAKAGYAKLRARLDPIVEKTQADPEFAASRLFMNWDTHTITPLVAKSMTVGGEGRAPIPTPRFAGARNWATDYSRPTKFEDWTPYNDKGGKVQLRNGKTGQMEWVDPGLTGRNFETGNEFVMSLAADAAFVYWLTGDEKYATFSEHILTTYMNGFALMRPARPVPDTTDMMKIIGPTSFEVIHEQLATQVALAYDFLQPYLAAKKVDTKPIQLGLKRWAQRITDGGGRDGNWNLNQAVMITYAGLALEDDSAYADKRGRQFYIDVVLNADLPNQNGLTHVIKQGLDPKSKLWPEAAGYGFGSAAQLIELSSLLSADPAGAKVLSDPILPESVMAQRQMIYPNGLSNGVGDTTNARLNTGALELLIAHARKTGEPALEDKLTGLLWHEIDTGNYNREGRSDLFALTHYVDALKPVAATAATGPDRTFWFDGLNIMMQHNDVPGDAAHSLAAALYGTNGGHVHANGMAIELYGAGYILGADPGRGASYWTADHRGYYVTPVAHNTVVINGTSTYAEYKSPDKQMTVQAVEPAPGAAGLSPNISFTRGAFHYAQPAADQQRTLAVVRTGPKSGFYYDVFRSKTQTPSPEAFHDYFYHNMGQSLSLGDANGGTLSLNASNALAQPNLQKAYSYLTNERFAPISGDLRAQLDMKLPAGPTASMAAWMPAGPGRTLFAVDAPKNNTIREGIAAPLREIPMPTLIVRQKGQAWDAPFVAVYEPFTGDDGASIRAVHSAANDKADGFVATVVEGNATRVLLMQDAGERDRTADAVTFRGTFAAVFGPVGDESELYLGDGRSLSAGDASIQSAGKAAIAADARRDGAAWVVGSTAPVTLSLPFAGKPAATLLADGEPVANVQWKAAGDRSIATFTLPAGSGRRIQPSETK